MILKWFRIQILLFILFWGIQFVQGQNINPGDSVIICLKNDNLIPYKVMPGRALTIPVDIYGTSSESYIQKMSLPPGWSSIFLSKIIKITAKDTLNQLVSLLIPLNIKAGSYVITYQLVKESSGKSKAQLEIPILVEKKISVGIEQMDYSRLLISGETYKFGYSLINKSNTDLPVRLKIRSNFGKILMDSTVYHLKTGETRQIFVKVKPPETLREKRRLMIRAQAFVGDSLNDTKTSGSDVFPKLKKGHLVYHSFPVYVKGISGFQQLSASREWLYNYEMSGGGTFKDNSTTEFDFLVRGPKRLEQQNLLIPSRDEYKAQLKTKGLQIRTGDFTYQTTPLLGNSYYGFGGGAMAELSNVSVSSFYAHNRFSFYRQDVVAGHLKWQIKPNFSTSINGIWKDDSFKGQIGTARMEWKPVPDWSMAGEAALSDSPGGQSEATSISSEFDRSNMHWSFHYDWHGKRYPTYEQGARTLMGFASVKIFNGVSLFDRYQQNSQLIFSNQTNRSGLTISRNVSLFYEFARQKILSGFSPAYNNQQLAGLDFSFNRHWFRMGFDATVGKVHYRLTGHEGQNVRLSWRSGISFTRKFNISGGIIYTNGNTLYSEFNRYQLGGYASMDLYLGKSTHMLIRGSLYQYDQFTQQIALSGNQIQGELSHRFSFGHEIAIKGAYREYSMGLNLSGLVLSYTIPLHFHTQRSRSSGLVSGRVFDDVTGKGLPNIPIFLGESGAITDQKGWFYLPGRKPGSYNLSIATEDLPGNRILDQKYPVSVKVKGGSITKVRIHTIESGSVAGKVYIQKQSDSLYTNLNNASTAEVLPGVVVELKGADRILRRLSGGDGKFQFNGLKPGSYHLFLVPRFLPEGYKNRNNGLNIRIIGGIIDTVEVYAEPVIRNIQLVNSKPVELKAGESFDNQKQVASYKVKKGDWLAKIARDVYGDSRKWELIYNANKDMIENPNKIYPHMVLKIPKLDK